jgi:hypothetical protein
MDGLGGGGDSGMKGLGGVGKGEALDEGSEGGDGHVSAPTPSGVLTIVDPTVTSTEGSNRRGPGNSGEGIIGFDLRRDEHRVARSIVVWKQGLDGEQPP